VWRLNPPVEPRVLRQPEDTGGLDRVLAHALIEAWHDTTCPEGWQCRDRTLHMVSGVGPERAFALSNHPAVQRVLNHARGVGVARTGSGD
jgi:acyl-CoA reductase-like NAD-dependent aldehyde dehydrogenase